MKGEGKVEQGWEEARGTEDQAGEKEVAGLCEGAYPEYLRLG